MKRVIYQVRTFATGKKRPQDILVENFVPTVKAYAEFCGADHIVLGTKYVGWDHAMTFKMNLLKIMADSKYDEFLFLDDDVFVNKHENIFEEESDIIVRPQSISQKIKQRSKRPGLTKDYFARTPFAEIDIYPWVNYGVFFGRRNIVERLAAVSVADMYHDDSFLEEVDLVSSAFEQAKAWNIEWLATLPPGQTHVNRGIDELFLCYQLYRSSIEPFFEDEKWHWMYPAVEPRNSLTLENRMIRMKEQAVLVHCLGDGGRKVMGANYIRDLKAEEKQK
jgi:hypothetical protein